MTQLWNVLLGDMSLVGPRPNVNLIDKYIKKFGYGKVRIALPDAPAPTASILEKEYYTSVEDIILVAKKIFKI